MILQSREMTLLVHIYQYYVLLDVLVSESDETGSFGSLFFPSLLDLKKNKTI